MHDKLHVSFSFPDQTLISFGIHFEITERRSLELIFSDPLFLHKLFSECRLPNVLCFITQVISGGSYYSSSFRSNLQNSNNAYRITAKK